jgi:hypothetical protein
MKLALYEHIICSVLSMFFFLHFAISIIILIRVDKNADGHITEAEVKEVNNSSSLCLVFHLRSFCFVFALPFGDIFVQLFGVF